MMLIADEKIKRKWKKMRQEAEVEGSSVIVLEWTADDSVDDDLEVGDKARKGAK